MAQSTRQRLERIKDRDQANVRKPGTGNRRADEKREVQRSSRPVSPPEEKAPRRSPRKVNKVPQPSQQPTKKKAKAATRRQERHEQESQPKAHNIKKARPALRKRS